MATQGLPTYEEQIPKGGPLGWTGGTGTPVTGGTVSRNIANTMMALAPVGAGAAPVAAKVGSGLSAFLARIGAGAAGSTVLPYAVPAAGFGALAYASAPDGAPASAPAPAPAPAAPGVAKQLPDAAYAAEGAGQGNPRVNATQRVAKPAAPQSPAMAAVPAWDASSPENAAAIAALGSNAQQLAGDGVLPASAGYGAERGTAIGELLHNTRRQGGNGRCILG